jgi:signal transduction histidine kinase
MGTAMSRRVVLIEDNPGDARLLGALLQEDGEPAWQLEWADRLPAGLARLDAGGYEVVLLDLGLPGCRGLEAFHAVQRQEPELPVVILSGLDDQALAVTAVQAGAQDYLVKGRIDGAGLVRALRYAVERAQLRAREQAARAQAERLAADRAVLIDQLAALERQKDEFFANLSHDLRTPIAGITASIGVVLANLPPDLPGPLQRMLVNIDAAASQMAVLVDDLLDLTRLQAGRLHLTRAPSDLREVAERAAGIIEPLARERGQHLVVDLPAAPVPQVVDVARLERVLTNLLGNAVTFGRAGGRIQLRLRPEGTAVHLAVTDDGPGIPPEAHDRIFERFTRLEPETGRQAPGSGLGLAIARALVELHGGHIGVTSAPGQGATFWISLPASPAAAVERAREQPP